MDLAPKDINVLIIDDEEEILDALRTHLQLNEFTVDTTSSATEALKLFNEKSHHILLIDIKMPDVDGLELLQTFKEINSGVVAIMITGYTSLPRVLQSKEAGAHSYMLKPFRDLSQVDGVLNGAVDYLNAWNKIIQETKTLQEGD